MTQKTPSKPKPTEASDRELVRHYNSQVPAYNDAIMAMDEKRRPKTGQQQEFKPEEHADKGVEAEWGISREELIELIKRQNLRLGRHIRQRAHELLLHHTTDKTTGDKVLKDGRYTVGLTYQAILDQLSLEFPECSTSAAALRWYVTNMKDDATAEGLPWPPLPQVRPRSSAKKET